MPDKIKTEGVVKVSNRLGSVTLTITIGNGQVGSSSVFVDFELKNPAGDGQVQGLPLGTCDELKGLEAEVFTKVSDQNPATNKTSVTYEFDVAGAKVKRAASAEAPEGSFVRYQATFRFE